MTWQPIETAPKDGTYVILADGTLLPDVARWQNEIPERTIYGNLHLAVPEGWFRVSRSRIRDPKWWCSLPDPPVEL